MAQAPPAPSSSARRLIGQPRWLNATAAWIPVIACFLGGATEKWAEGIVVLLVGLLLLVDPPLRSLGLWFNLLLLAFVGYAILAFLPADLFGAAPAWRTAVTADFEIPLPGTVSPQPWVTFGCLLSLIAGVAWLYNIAGSEFELREVRFQLRLFALGIVVLAALCLLLYAAGSSLPFWHNQRNFGPFPNRNQTGNLFGITAILILACMEEDFRKRKWIRGVIWSLGLATVIAAVILNFSRAGLAIVAGGSILWLAALLLRKPSPARIALALSVMLALLTALLVFGGKTLDRFQLRGDAAAGISGDFRLLIFRDALQLTSTAPWTGIGLGNFEYVFAVFRDASQANSRALHPESDWFWLAAEMGWPAVGLVLLGLLVLARLVLPLREGTNQRLRLATLLGAALFALHGLVDVSGHRVGTVYAAIFLFGLSLHRPLRTGRSRVVPILFRVVGLLLIPLGLSWIVAERGDKAWPGRLGAEHERQKAVVANRGRNFQAGLDHVATALQWTPLDWQLYFVRANAQLGLGRPAEALQDFRRARFLEPNSPTVPLEEGRIWMNAVPTLAVTAWREALHRAGPEGPRLFSYMLSIAPVKTDPGMRRALGGLARLQPGLMLEYLGWLDDADFNSVLQQFLERHPDLEKLSRDEQKRLFDVWARRGEMADLVRLVERRPGLLEQAWPAVAEWHAAQGDLRAAVELARRFVPAPVLPEPAPGALTDLQRAAYRDATAYGAGYALYREQLRGGQVDDALVTLRRFTANADVPAYFHYLEATAWTAQQNWERSWAAWQKYLSATSGARR